MSQEIQRLNDNLKRSADENNNLQNRLRELQQEYDSMKRGNVEYEGRFTQITREYQTKISTYETKITQITHENE